MQINISLHNVSFGYSKKWISKSHLSFRYLITDFSLYLLISHLMWGEIINETLCIIILRTIYLI